ncbi:MAG TPA: hypothetical protein VH092_18245 [Urbifossiella sp.]|nr:hypothetical protein [Urbifossiella sp.]
MSKLLSSLLAATLVAGLVTVSGPSPAQDKKDPKKETKAAKTGGVVKVSEGKDGKFRFSVYDADENYVGGSGPVGFESKEAAAKAVDTLKTTLATAKIEYPKKDAKKDEKK